MIRQIAATSATLIVSFLLFEFSAIDIMIQNKFFNFEINQWIIDRNDQVLKFIFYDGIKRLYLILVLLVIVTLVLFSSSPVVVGYKQDLRVVLLSLILVPLLIGTLKASTNMPCPRDLQIYNGLYPHVTLLESYPENLKPPHRLKCYPAGHASGGFALLAFFFLFKTRRSKTIAVVAAITLGWVIGSYKILIGDHFISHNVVAMLIAWLLILFLNRFLGSYNSLKGSETYLKN